MKKSFGILLSAALLLTFCVSGNLAVSAAETETVVETEQQDAALKEGGSQEEQNGKDMISEEQGIEGQNIKDQDAEGQNTQNQDTEKEDAENLVEDTSGSETDSDAEDISDGQTDEKSHAESDDDKTVGTNIDDTETDKEADADNPDTESNAVTDKETSEISDSKTDEEDALTVHIETCSDDCQDELCLCSCHLFGRLMACETLEELYALAEETPEEELLALTEEQNVKIEEKIAGLEPEPLPEVIIPESTDKPVTSEIVYPTVNFSKVAPFGAPVEG